MKSIRERRMLFCCLVMSCFICLQQQAACGLSGGNGGNGGDGGNSKIWCEQRFSAYFQDARESLMRAWNVLDILRSITIAPRYRVQFIERLVGDILSMLLSVSSLHCCCEWCSSYCNKFTVDFIDLEERVTAMHDAFEAVCADQRCGEESIIATLIQKTENLLIACDQVVQKAAQR